MPGSVLFVFVVTDQQLANSVMDLLTGRTAATLAALAAEEETLLRQAQAMSTETPPKAA